MNYKIETGWKSHIAGLCRAGATPGGPSRSLAVVPGVGCAHGGSGPAQAGVMTSLLRVCGRWPCLRLLAQTGPASTANRGLEIRWLICCGLVVLAARVNAIEDPPGCSLASGGRGNTSQGGINFNLNQAHLGDAIQIFPSLGMVTNACRAINTTGAVYIATGLLTNFLENVTLDPGVLVSCPANPLCRPGPYYLTLTPALVGAGVASPNGSVSGLPNTVRVVENGLGTILAGDDNDQMSDFHSASIQIVTPCIQVFITCDLPAGQGCFDPNLPVRIRGYVTNCGDITLTNVIVRDDRGGQPPLFNPTNGAALPGNVTLPPGAYAVFSNQFMPTISEVCASNASGFVTATGTDTTAIGGPRASVTNSASELCPLCINPAIRVATACPAAPPVPGGLLLLSGTVSNAGTLALTNVTVTSDRTLAGGGTLVGTFSVLTNGEVRTFSASYRVPTNACTLTNTLTAQGLPPCGLAAVTHTATTPCAVSTTPRLGLTQACPAVAPALGELLVFSGTVTNLGDVAVTNLVIVNQHPTNNSPVTFVNRLEPGQGTNFTGSYLVTTNGCSLTDTLQVTGLAVCGGAVTAELTWNCVQNDPPPTITCASNKTVMAGTPWTFDPPSANDTTDGTNVNVIVVGTQTNLVCADAYVATRTWRALDSCGKTAECSQTVTVVDRTPPQITCPSNLVVNAANGLCASNVAFTVSATDACGVTNLVSAPPSGSTFPVGVTTVTNTATDASGNQSSCTFTVTVIDNQNPVITCPSNFVLSADAGRCSRSNVTFNVVATDNCALTNLVSTPPSGSTFPVGVTSVTNIATDASGRSSTCVFTVEIKDLEKPQITCPSDLILDADANCQASNVSLGTPVTSDNCAVANVTNNAPLGPGGLGSEPSFPISSLTVSGGTVTLRWVSQTGRTYRVLYKDSLAAAGWSVVPGDVTATGLVTSLTNLLDGAAQRFFRVQLLTGGGAGPFGLGTNLVTWTVTDSSGNTNSCVQRVIVRDTTAPTLLCPSNLVLTTDPGRCSRSNVTFTVNASDNCSITNLVSNPPTGSTFPVGVTTVTNIATDGSGNQTSCTFTVTVTDNENPVITCPSNLVLSTDAGQCSRSNVTFSVTASDNCGVTNLVIAPPSGSTFPVGVTTVTNFATDASGNTSSCVFTVTVRDLEKPVITCPSNLVFIADAGVCSRSNVTFVVNATDNCSVTNLVSTPPSGSTFLVGVTTVTNTATDASGNTGSCTFTVTVLDTQNPVITCPSNLVLSADAGQCSRSNLNFNVSAMDNCSVTNLVSSPPNGSMFPVGVTTVTNTATDASGNQSSCTFTVTVTDDENPVITCPTNLVLNTDPGRCSRSNVTFTVTATDNCAVTNLVSTSPSGSTFPVGVTTVTNTATDRSGHQSSCTFTVTVRDLENPVVTCSSNLVLTADAGVCSRSNVTFAVNATDNCSVTNLVSAPPSGSTFPVGVTTVTNIATDASGNTGSCTFTVTVLDTQNPVITCPSNLVLSADAGRCSRSNVNFNVSAMDNCSVTNLVSSPPNGSMFPVGVTTVTNTATDASGNQSSCTFTVTVTDDENPVITCPTNLVLNTDPGRCSRSNVTFTVTATDNCAVTNLVSTSPSGSTFPVGVTTVTNTATDRSGHQSSCTFTVTVRDLENPVVTCSSNLVLTADAGVCSRSNVTFAVNATDNCSVTNLVSTPPSGSTFPVGVTTVTNTATDASGNTGSCTFTVTVLDAQNPVITCSSNLVLTADAGRCSRSNVSFTVSATDNCSVTNLVSSPPNGSTFPVGVTTVTNTATDASGNQSSCTFTVRVLDNQNPVITCPTNLVFIADAGRCSRSNVSFTVSATDNCSVTNLVSSPPSGSTFPVGVSTVTNYAADASGNTSSCTFTVTVTDTQNPVISCPSNLVLATDLGRCNRSNVTYVVSASDNCSVTNLVISPPSGSTFALGTTTVTNYATDASGNTSSCTFTVTVTDNQNPVITCSSNLVLAADAGQCSRSNVNFTVSATDNCAVTNLVSGPPSGSTFPLGVTTVTNTATDAGGNRSTCTFTVTVVDTQNPVITCPSNLVLAADAAWCGRSNVTFSVTATDNCSVTNLVSSKPSGSAFPVGVTVVTNTAADASGNSAACTFSVTVLDQQPPNIVCPPNLVLYLPAGQGSVTNPAIGTAVATDNCGVASVTNNAPSVFLLGTNLVVWRATDIYGNSNSCQQFVEVRACSGIFNVTGPTNKTVCPNTPVTFAVTANSGEPISYQWRLNGQELPGQTNNSVLVPYAGPDNVGTYSVDVSTPCNAVTKSAFLDLLPGPGGSPASYTNSNPITINESGPADPYLSFIPPQCVPGVVRKLTVNLFGYFHAFPADVSVMLISPSGRRVMLMSGAGDGNSIGTPVNLTFSDAAANLLPENGAIVAGTYRPTDYLHALPVGMPAPAAEPYFTELSAFIGDDANGAWKLAVFDGHDYDGGGLSGWSLELDWREKILRLLNPRLLANGQFTAEVQGQTGILTIIEGSSNLTTWMPVATNVLVANPGAFVDPGPPARYRFYRALQP